MIILSMGVSTIAMPVMAQQETPTSPTPTPTATPTGTDTPTATPTEDSTVTEESTPTENETETPAPSEPNQPQNPDGETNETGEQESESPIENPDHVFVSGLEMKQLEHSEEEFKLKFYNPNDSEKVITIAERGDGRTYRQPYTIEANDTLTVTYDVQEKGLISNEISITEALPVSTLKEIANQGGNANAQSTIVSYQIIDLNAFPSMPHNILVMLVGTFTSLSTSMMWILKLGTGKFGIRPVNYKGAKSALQQEISKVRLDVDTTDRGFIRRHLYSLGRWMYQNALILIHGFVIISGFLYFFGVGIFDYTLANSAMVWLSYGILAGLPFTFLLIWYFKSQKYKFIWDIQPEAKGDVIGWLISPAVWQNMTVINKTRNDDDEVIYQEVSKDMLAEINRQTKRDEFEVIGYDPINNIAFTSWAGVDTQLNSHEVRRHKEMMPKLYEKLPYIKHKLNKLQRFYKDDVQNEANYLSAQKIAMVEGELHEGYDAVHERIDERMENRGEEDILDQDSASIIEKAIATVRSNEKIEPPEQETEE